ncbi:hypothetical protein ACFDTO_07525 [Microbacteriaceae bacterium 4G12]
MSAVARISAPLAAVLIASSISGCTGPVTPTPPDDGWSSRTSSLLTDPDSSAGAAGGAIRSPGDQLGDTVFVLDNVPAGTYDLLGICQDAEAVHLTATKSGEDGPRQDPDGVLAESDLACGAVTRLPVTSAGPGVALHLSGPDGAEWAVSLVTPGWEPPASE